MGTSGMMAGRQHRSVGRALVRLIGAFVLTLAFDACSIGTGSTSGNTSGRSTSANDVTIRVKVETGNDGATVVLLPVTINGHGPYTFALDTGASISLVDKSLAHQLGLPQVGQPGQISGVASDEQAIPVKVSNWHIESLTLPSVTVAAANLFSAQNSQGLKGLVGADVWRDYGSLTINFKQQTITVPKQAAASLLGASQAQATALPAYLSAVRPDWAEAA